MTGCYEPVQPSPLDNMTEEQKEYEAMKLVNVIDKLIRCVDYYFTACKVLFIDCHAYILMKRLVKFCSLIVMRIYDGTVAKVLFIDCHAYILMKRWVKFCSLIVTRIY